MCVWSQPRAITIDTRKYINRYNGNCCYFEVSMRCYFSDRYESAEDIYQNQLSTFCHAHSKFVCTDHVCFETICVQVALHVCLIILFLCLSLLSMTVYDCFVTIISVTRISLPECLYKWIKHFRFTKCFFVSTKQHSKRWIITLIMHF